MVGWSPSMAWDHALEAQFLEIEHSNERVNEADGVLLRDILIQRWREK